MTGYYDKDGSPMDLMEWARTFEDDEYKVVAYTVVALDESDDDVRVSTVWLGLDHQYGDGPPLIFETMVFGGDHDGDQWRYTTQAEALAGHEDAVRIVQAALGDPLPPEVDE